MTDLRNQKRLAASILKCGRNRVWVDPDRSEEVAQAATRGDVRVLASGGAIKALQKTGISKGRARKAAAQKAKGRRTGQGSRKGTANARQSKKDRWMKTIRALRASLMELRDTEVIDRSVYREYYRRVKGGQFRSKAHMRNHMVMEGIIKEEK
ncbi:MAG: 50S ribosomal protein L19e [Thermoplasmata archaeon HGW-Thermoplasmata-1]|nr:MAG: 50S ribosomal protein L19e [Thermoplasmata archaeon HGW-Thermoplasmata-1]